MPPIPMKKALPKPGVGPRPGASAGKPAARAPMAAPPRRAPARSGLPAHLAGFATARSLAQGDYFERDGAFLVRPSRCVHQESDNPSSRGAWFFVAELRIMEILDQSDGTDEGQGKATKKNDIKSFYQGFEYADTALGAIKAFLKPTIYTFLAEQDEETRDALRTQPWWHETDERFAYKVDEHGSPTDEPLQGLPSAVAAINDDGKESLTDADLGSEEFVSCFSEEQPYQSTDIVVVVKMKPAGKKSKRQGEFFPSFKWYTVAEWNEGAGE